VATWRRRTAQERLQPTASADDLFGEVVVEVPVATRQAADHRPDLVARPPPNSRLDEAQRGDPALGRPREVLEEIRFQRVAVGLPEEPLHLLAVEPQICGRELRDLPRAQPRERKWRQPRRDDEGQRTRTRSRERSADSGTSSTTW
jgi:hypothetical protein